MNNGRNEARKSDGMGEKWKTERRRDKSRNRR